MKKVMKPLGVIFLIILIALTGCKKSDSGTNSENPSTPTIPTGAINGLFTINENGGQVYFSQGNLQYQAQLTLGVSPNTNGTILVWIMKTFLQHTTV